jgi:hypothetical protein
MSVHLIEFCSLKAARRRFLIGLTKIWNGKGGLVDSWLIPVCLVRGDGFLFLLLSKIHVLFYFLPRGGSVVIHIEGRTAKDATPILFGLPTEVAWTVSSIESLMTRPCVPVIVEKIDDIHLMILR